MRRPASKHVRGTAVVALAIVIASLVASGPAGAAGPRDLPEVLEAGTLRHLVIPYASFVTGRGDGLDVEVVQRFADYLGVGYQQVQTDWDRTISDLTGVAFEHGPDGVRVTGEAPVRGDIIAHGMTMLAWREELVAFARPLFPTQVWLLVRADSPLAPIRPTGDVAADIRAVDALLPGLEVLTKPGTCLDPDLLGLRAKGARVAAFAGSLNFLAPAVLEGQAESTILEVPDALAALRRFPGRVKVIGPLSPPRAMAPAFAPESVQLRAAFADFAESLIADGTYARLVSEYYPAVLEHFPGFFPEGQVHP